MESSMTEYIWSVLRMQLSIVLSWGFNNPRAIENGLQFKVQGFLFTGIVKVIYNKGADTFIVRLERFDGSKVKEVDDVYFDELVRVIDSLVEKDCSQEEYIKKVNATYGY